MISFDPLTGATNGSLNAHGGQSESHSNGWLLELERAWLDSERGRNDNSRAGAVSRHESSMTDVDEGNQEKKFGGALREGSSAGITGSLSSYPAPSNAVASASNLHFDSRMPAAFASPRQVLEMSVSANQLSANGKAPNVFTGTTLSAPARSAMPEQSSLASTKEGDSKAEAQAQSDASYPEKRLHLLEDERGVRVWIRDAALSEQRGFAVANSLRAELGAAGLRLVAVALNGKEIAGNGESSPGSGTAPLEQDSRYVRSMIHESDVSIEKLSQEEHS